VQRVDLGHDEIAINVDLSRLVGEGVPAIRRAIRARMKRRGVEMRPVLESGMRDHEAKTVDPALVKAIVRAHGWFGDLVSGRARSLCDIARAEGVTDRYVSHLLRLAFLAPRIVVAILEGAQPVDLTIEALTKRIDLPLAWMEQKSRLGFDRR